MKYFDHVDIPSFPELFDQMQTVITAHDISWRPNNQICINTVPGHESDPTYGTGSLQYDWSQHTAVEVAGLSSLEIPRRQEPLQESDFTIICTQFKGTIFETIYDLLSARYHIGRIRLMRSEPKTCLSWHKDDSSRLHYPIKTQAGCFMVIDDEVYHIPENRWTMTLTENLHTAFNASKHTRIHLVACILGNR